MGDENDGFALFAQPPQNTKQLIGFRWGQYAGGFIEDQYISPAVQRFEDLNPLLHTHANLLNHRIWVYVQLIFRSQFRQFRPRLAQGGR